MSVVDLHLDLEDGTAAKHVKKPAHLPRCVPVHAKPELSLATLL